MLTKQHLPVILAAAVSAAVALSLVVARSAVSSGSAASGPPTVRRHPASAADGGIPLERTLIAAAEAGDLHRPLR
jgi:hypothetical protein